MVFYYLACLHRAASKRLELLIMCGLIFSSTLYAAPSCQLTSLNGTQNETQETLIFDRKSEISLASGLSKVALSCISDVPLIFTFRRNGMSAQWQQPNDIGSPVTSNQMTYIIPQGDFTGVLTLDAIFKNVPQFSIAPLHSYIHSSQSHTFLMGLFYGLCITLAAYVLIIGKSLREKCFILYSFYVLSAGTLFLIQEGQLNLFLNGSSLINHWKVYMLVAGLTVFSGSLFFLHLLTYPITWYPKLRYLVAFPASLVLLTSLILLLPLPIYWVTVLNEVMGYISLLVITIIFMVLIYATYKKIPDARLVIGASLCVVIAMLFRVLFADFSPFLNRYAILIAFSIEVFILAIVTSNQIKRVNEHRLQAEEEAMSDSLCDLLNRRGWQHRAQELLTLQQEKQGYLCLMYIDLDYFKQINDEYGHQVGDEVLKVTAKIIQHTARTTDAVGRIGGDEFVMLGHFTDAEQCENVAERLRIRLKTFKIQTQSFQLNMSASVGYRIFTDAPASVNDMLEQGDMAMYQAKKMRHKRPVTI